MNSKIFALMDCNNFYASCERVFNPALRGKPIVVLSNNDGCIVARSNEAKQLGIPMGAPFFKYEKLINHYKVYVFSSNYALYGDMSDRVMSLLDYYSPDIEIYSIDEAFLRFDLLADKNFMERACIMREYILRATGIPISIGISNTKTLAKIANKIAKKSTVGVFQLNPDNIDTVLASIEVEDIWGIAHRMGLKLRQLNINTALDLKRTSPIKMRKLFNIMIERTVHELNGISCLDLEQVSSKKNIMSSRSFGTRLTELTDISAAISSFCARASEKLRAQQSLATGMYIFLRTSYFNTNAPQYSNSITMQFETPTDDTGYIIQTAKTCLRQIYKKGYHYQKAGVLLMDLIGKKNQQPSLFTVSPARDKTMAVIDKINAQMGTKTIYFGAEGNNRRWRTKCEQRSPCYTTNWRELLKVTA